MRASGELGSPAEMREVVRHSTRPARYEPGNVSTWRAAAQRLASLRKCG
jgi:hypothetical protein